MAWGTAPESDESLQIKAEMADYLKGLNATGDIDYKTYSEAFNFSMSLLDKMYELGKNTKI